MSPKKIVKDDGKDGKDDKGYPPVNKDESDDDFDFYDPDAGSSNDMEKLIEKITGLSLEDATTVQETMEKKAKTLLLKMKKVREHTKMLKKEETKANAETKKKEAYEKRKKDAKDAREAEIKVTIKYNGVDYVLTVKKNITVGVLRRMLAVQANIRTKHILKVTMSFKETVITNNPRKVLHSFGIEKDAVIYAEIPNNPKPENEVETMSVSFHGDDVQIDDVQIDDLPSDESSGEDDTDDDNGENDAVTPTE
eukprot:Skav234982  [mRNA]  locus=scaffold122:206594:207349:+ [translate_table: standard]